MKFPNAASGVRKLFAAQILMIIGVLVMGVGSILAAVFTIIAEENSDTAGAIVLAIGMLVCVFGGLVVLLVASIIRIVGLAKGGSDEKNFKYALIAILIGAAAVATGSFLQSSNIVLYNIFDTVYKVADLMATIFIIQGIMNLAAKLGDSIMVAKGAAIFKIILAIYVFAILGSLTYAVMFPFPFLRIFGVALVCFSLFLSIVCYIFFISYLAKAKNMLA